MRNAISYVQRRAEVDPQRIGLWGTSFGGAIVSYTAAVDRRVRAVVSQVPVVKRPELGCERCAPRATGMRCWTASMQTASSATTAGQAPTFRQGVRRWMRRCPPASPSGSVWRPKQRRRGEAANRQLTLESVERVIEFFPEHMIHMIGPRPLRIITTAERDVVHPLDQIQEAYERAREPKDLVLLPLRQYDAYSEPGLTIANESAREWFRAPPASAGISPSACGDAFLSRTAGRSGARGANESGGAPGGGPVRGTK